MIQNKLNLCKRHGYRIYNDTGQAHQYFATIILKHILQGTYKM